MKKMIVPYSIEKGKAQGKSFILPIHDGYKNVFVSSSKLKPIEHGMVVFIGRDISPEYVFAKIVNSDVKILPSVDDQMTQIRNFLEKISDFKIGDLVSLNFDQEGQPIIKKVSKPKKRFEQHKLP